MERWSEYTIDLGNIPQDELTKAASLSAPENKSLNVMIYRAIAALNSNIAPKPNPSIRKTPPSGLDPDASRLPSEVQKNAVNFLLSNVCWGIKGLTGLALNSATLVDWPELLVPNPGSGEKVRYDGKNYYRVPVSAIFDTLNGIYREKVALLQRVVNLMADNSKGPSSMYAAINCFSSSLERSLSILPIHLRETRPHSRRLLSRALRQSLSYSRDTKTLFDRPASK